MCGIAGIFHPTRILPAAAGEAGEAMCRAMLYRGPDEGGQHRDEHVVLGHRRLSIIDISSGKQPMHSRDGRLTLVFNGEIYNYRELKQELQRSGFTFRTASDTEVLLVAYAAWGREMLRRLRGMFAFALYDKQENLLLAARDPLGKKPFYFTRDAEGALYFASDLKALCAGGKVRGKLSQKALRLYFTLGYIPAPDTIYQDVHKLAAGHALNLSSEGLREWEYWDIHPAAAGTMRESDALDRLTDLVDTAVSRRLVSDVPLGAFLSGGIDSNLVVESMSRASPDPVKTYTVGFGEKSAATGVTDERELAADSARRLGTSHEEITLDGNSNGNLDGLLPSLMPFLGEPLADPSIIPTYLVCQAARKKVTVALTGDGGDEPFGGYSFRYAPHMIEERIRRYLPTEALGPLLGVLGRSWPRAPYLPRYLRLHSLFRNLAVSSAEAIYLDLSPAKQGNGALRGKWDRGPGFEHIRALYGKSQGQDELTRLLYVDAKSYMTENVLVKADRMSMANSLELRSPLLDQDLVTFAFTVPASLKIRDGKCKYLLRRLAERRGLLELVDKPKMGFSLPVDRYLRSLWREDFEARAWQSSSPLEGILDLLGLRRLWDGFLRGDNGHFQFLWAAYVFCLWHEHFHAQQRFAG